MREVGQDGFLGDGEATGLLSDRDAVETTDVLPHTGVGDTRSTVARAHAVLSAFLASDGSISLSELSRRTSLPKATLHRLVGQLVTLNMLERVGTSYELGTRIFELAKSVPIQRRLREIAVPYMADLYEATHETVHLGVMEGLDVLYVDRIAGHRQVECPTRVGGRMPAFCTGLGKAMLAFAAPHVLEELRHQSRDSLTPYSITSFSALEAQLREIRRVGFAIDQQEAMLGVSCVAAPIRISTASVAAISVTGPTRRIQIQSLAPAVRTTALTLSRIFRDSAVLRDFAPQPSWSP